MRKGKTAVLWELSDEGTVRVDVDVPLRPFGTLPTPPRGVPEQDVAPAADAPALPPADEDLERAR